MSRKTDTVETLPMWVLVVAGLGSLNAGVVMFLCALDVIPTPDSSYGAPRWIVALIAILPFSVGAMLTSELVARLVPRSVAVRNAAQSIARIAMLVIVVAFLHAVGAFLTWAAITGAEGETSLSVVGVTIPFVGPLAQILDRIGVGLVALIVDAMVVFVWICAAARVLGRLSS